MGIEYRGVVVLGYTYREVRDEKERLQNLEIIDQGISVTEFAEEHGLDRFAPYYDAGCGDCIFGTEVCGTYDYSVSLIDLNDIAETVLSETPELVSSIRAEPNLYLMAAGS